MSINVGLPFLSFSVSWFEIIFNEDLQPELQTIDVKERVSKGWVKLLTRYWIKSAGRSGVTQYLPSSNGHLNPFLAEWNFEICKESAIPWFHVKNLCNQWVKLSKKKYIWRNIFEINFAVNSGCNLNQTLPSAGSNYWRIFNILYSLAYIKTSKQKRLETRDNTFSCP